VEPSPSVPAAASSSSAAAAEPEQETGRSRRLKRRATLAAKLRYWVNTPFEARALCLRLAVAVGWRFCGRAGRGARKRAHASVFLLP
jgi:hypothetical protein